MELENRYAEGQAQRHQYRSVAKGNPYTHYATLPHRLRREIGENSIRKIQKPNKNLRRGEAPEMAKQGGRLAQLRDNICGEADSAAPNHPTHALLVQRWERAATLQQDQENECVNREATQEGHFGDALRRMAEHVGKAQQREHSNRDAKQRHGPLDLLPARFGSVM